MTNPKIVYAHNDINILRDMSAQQILRSALDGPSLTR